MSDVSAETARRSPEKNSETTRLDVARALYADVDSRPVTDLEGRTCRTQPTGDQIPTLRTGIASRGCEYQSAQDIANATGILDFGDIWRQVRREAVQVHSGRGAGSGVAIGATPDTCIVATNAHVVRPDLFGARARERESGNAVVMADGTRYPATVGHVDVANDRAALVVRTGARTAEVCRPARIAENPGEIGRGLAVGFPGGASSPYAHPAQLDGIQRALSQPRGGRRNQPEIFTRSNTIEGNSGGPIYNDRREVVGLVTRGPDPWQVPNNARTEREFDAVLRRYSIGTPINPTIRDTMIRESLRVTAPQPRQR
ncbi:MAG: trypsin-like peptidase domain-containing protein [Leptolyngbya sp.]|nr:trypsin-like peptidase domain-containing protein [Candidatus Melainabacteria bacterium]